MSNFVTDIAGRTRIAVGSRRYIPVDTDLLEDAIAAHAGSDDVGPFFQTSSLVPMLATVASMDRLIGYVELFSGTVRQASVYPREVVKESLARNAAALVLVHNHPSGLTEPTRAEHLTQTLKRRSGNADQSAAPGMPHACVKASRLQQERHESMQLCQRRVRDEEEAHAAREVSGRDGTRRALGCA